MKNISTARAFIQLFFLMAIVPCILYGCSKPEAPLYKGPPTKMTVGVFPSDSNALLFVADYRGYFKQMGLDVALREFDSGVPAVAALNEGLVDLATAADFVFVTNISKHPEMRIMASINMTNNIYIVARKDRGIAQPKDLKGKRIAVTKGSNPEFFLRKYLHVNRLQLKDITMVHNVPQSMMTDAIVAGTIDAAVIPNQISRRMQEKLGDSVVKWPIQGNNTWQMLLMLHDGFAKKEAAALVRFMKALIMAEQAIAENPAEVQLYLSKRFKMPEKYFADVWGDNQFRVSLERSLMLTLEEESRWNQKSQGATDILTPNYLDYLYMTALEAARPESVTIIH